MTALPGLFPCTGVGSLPHLDPRAAVAEVLSRFREIPYWPQLPRRAPLEHMYPQYAAGAPRSGADRGTADHEERGGAPSGRGGVLRDVPLRRPLPVRHPQGTGVRTARAAGFDRRSLSRGERPDDRARLLRAHGVRPGEEAGLVRSRGPGRAGEVSAPRRSMAGFASSPPFRNRDPHAGRTVSRLRGLRHRLPSAGGGDRRTRRDLRRVARGTLRDPLLREHRLGPVLSSKVGYLSFDAYEYADSLLLYPEEVSAFLAHGGVLAFGVVPTASGAIAAETPESLADRMEGILDRFASRGISREAVVRASTITPACGLGHRPKDPRSAR